MPRKKTNSKSKGRPNAFSEEKLAFLESYGDEWLTSTDRTALYTLITKRFLLKFGYDLELNKNPPEGYVVNVEIDPSLSVEARLEESTRRDALYKVLRAKLGNWYRHKYTDKNTNQAFINKIIDKISSASASRPRKKSPVKVYSSLYKEEKLKPQFDAVWATVQDTVDAKDRMKLWNEFVHSSWSKESEEVKARVLHETEVQNETALAEWKKRVVFSGTAEGYQEAWQTAESVLPTFADALSEWLGASIFIFGVCPVGSAGGEMLLQSAQSDTSKGMTKKLLPEFDPEGFQKMHNMMTKYGTAYFSPEECLRRKVEPKDIEVPQETIEPEENELDVENDELDDGRLPVSGSQGPGPDIAGATGARSSPISPVPTTLSPTVSIPPTTIQPSVVQTQQSLATITPIILGNDGSPSVDDRHAQNGTHLGELLSTEPPFSAEDFDFSGLDMNAMATALARLNGQFPDSAGQMYLPDGSQSEWFKELMALDLDTLMALDPDTDQIQAGPSDSSTALSVAYIQPHLLPAPIPSLETSVSGGGSANTPAISAIPVFFPTPTQPYLFPTSVTSTSPLVPPPPAQNPTNAVAQAPSLSPASQTSGLISAQVSTDATEFVPSPSIPYTQSPSSNVPSFSPTNSTSGLISAQAPIDSSGLVPLPSALYTQPQLPVPITGTLPLAPSPTTQVSSPLPAPAPPLAVSPHGGPADVSPPAQKQPVTVSIGLINNLPSAQPMVAAPVLTLATLHPSAAPQPTSELTTTPDTSLTSPSHILPEELPSDKENQAGAPVAKKATRGRKRKSDVAVGEVGSTAPAVKKIAREKRNSTTRGKGGAGRGGKKMGGGVTHAETDAVPTTRSGRTVKMPKPADG